MATSALVSALASVMNGGSGRATAVGTAVAAAVDATTTTICIPFEFTGVCDMQPDAERRPSAHFQLTSNVSRTRIGEWLSPDRPVPVQFVVCYPRNSSSSQHHVREVVARALRECYLNVDVFVETRSKLGEWCRKSAGNGEVLLMDLFDSRNAIVRLELRVRQADGNMSPKSRMAVRATGPITVDNTPLVLYDDSLRNAEAVASKVALERRRAARRAALKRYMYACHHLFTRMPPTFAATQRINCYILKLRSGAAIPSLGYLMQHAPPVVDPLYFQRNLEMVLRRERLSLDDFCALADTDKRACNIAMQTLCMYSNWAMYIGDEGYLRECLRDGSLSDLKLRDLEEFELVELYGADDCEGSGSKVIRDSHYLLSLDAAQCTPEVQKLQRIRSHFWLFLMLCGVTSGDVAGDFRALSAKSLELGAHMYCVAIPVRRALQMIENCNLARPVFHSMPTDVELMVSDDAHRQLPPVVFGEGTGLLTPLPIELPKKKRLVLPIGSTAEHGLALQRLLDSVQRDEIYLTDKSSAFLLGSGAANVGCAVQEGAGSANCALSNNSLWLTDVMRAVHPHAVIGVRTWYHWCAGKYGDTSHFYRSYQVGFTADAMRLGYGVGSFVLVRRASADAPWTVGCTLPDLCGGGGGDQATGDVSPLVGLWAEPELCDSEAAYIRQELNNAPAVPPILPAPSVAGESNMTWDRTAMVPSAEQYAAIRDTVVSLHATAARAALESMLRIASEHGVEHDELDHRVLGVPHLDATCSCGQYAAAVLLVQQDNELRARMAAAVALPADSAGRRVLDAFVDRFVTLYCRDDRLPVAPALAINRQQIQRRERVAALHRLATSVMHVQCGEGSGSATLVSVCPGGVHIDAEQVTADTGGYYTVWYSLVAY